MGHRLPRAAALAAAVLLSLACGEELDRFYVPAGADIRNVVAGSWDWEESDESCGRFTKTISFPPDEMTMVFTYAALETNADEPEPTDTYDIWALTRNYVRGQIRGEMRLTPSGALVVWDLVLLSPDVFCWQRTDWESDACTTPLIRCPR